MKKVHFGVGVASFQSKTIFCSLRSSDQILFMVPFVSKEVCKKAFMFQAPSDWNKLPVNIHFLFKNVCFLILKQIACFQ